MAWIKRNLIFVIGGLISIGLLGGAGFYLFQNHKARQEKREKLTAEYATLDQLTTMSPGPGDGKKVDNIRAAKQYAADLQGFNQRAGKFFAPIAPIPNQPQVNAAEFAAELRNTIGQMQRDATNASVQLLPNYDFSFSDIKSLISFKPGSLQPLSVQLGEVKAISEVFFKAKVNSIDSIRRERVSPDDTGTADYIELHSVTSELTVVTPYEISFRCFSAELAAVLGGFIRSPHCFLVKNISVDSGELASGAASGAAAPSPYSPPQPAPSAPAGGRRRNTEDPDFFFYDVVPPAAARTGLPTVLDEQTLRVTILLEVVKLNTAAASQPPAASSPPAE